MKKTQPSSDINLLVSKLDKHSLQILSIAAESAYSSKHSVLDIPHFLLSLFERNGDATVANLLDKGFDVGSVRVQLKKVLSSYRTENLLPPGLSDQLLRLLKNAWVATCMQANSSDVVDMKRILKSLCDDDEIFPSMCSEIPALTGLISSIGSFNQEVDKPDDETITSSNTSPIDRYTVDLTARARAGMLDPVIGRDNEIAQVVEILLRRRQNNPILTGEAGVGKTAIVEGLAQRIADKLIPKDLQHVRLCSLDIGLLRAGASMRGEIELRLKSIISDINTSVQPIILFIDEAHTIVGANGGQSDQSDIANLIKPELARGTLRTIAATTWSEYKRYFEKDAALSRRFQTVKVEEASVAVSMDILQALIPSLEKHHGVSIMQTAVESAVKLSARYIQGRQLPDKAISVLDTACARAVSSMSIPAQERMQLLALQSLYESKVGGWQREVERTGIGIEGLTAAQQELTELRVKLNVGPNEASSFESNIYSDGKTDIYVSANDIASVVADWTGVPSQKMRVNQSLLVAQLERVIAQRVVGQSTATNLICNRLRAYTAKLEDPSRPIGVFLLTGPSGVGKTETAHAIAEAFFGKSGITVVNMSEYQESHTVSKLKGAPAGYVGYGQGGVLTESIRRQPYGLLLLDEVEKAHPDVLDMFLQVFDKGFMEDSEGTVIDFKNILVLMTSNVGTDLLTISEDSIDKTQDGISEFNKKLEEELLPHFKPAFLGRAQIVPYFMLEKSDLLKIVEMKLKTISDRFMTTYFAELKFSSDVYISLVNKCAAQTIGARWLDQYISEHLLSRISLVVLEKLATGERVRGLEVTLDGSEGILVDMTSVESKGEEAEIQMLEESSTN